MSKRRSEINLTSGIRLSEWLQEVNITQKELANRIYYTQQQISKIVNGKAALSPQLAEEISEAAPKPFFNDQGEIIGYEHVRVSWLLGLDDIKTDCDNLEHKDNQKNLFFNSAWTVLDNAARKHGAKILLNHPYPKAPDYLSLIGYQKDSCSFQIQKDGKAIKELAVYDFIGLVQQVERYAEFLIWEQIEEGYNG